MVSPVGAGTSGKGCGIGGWLMLKLGESGLSLLVELRGRMVIREKYNNYGKRFGNIWYNVSRKELLEEYVNVYFARY